MKKIISLLSLLLLVVVGASAQIASVSELSNDKQYTVVSDRGSLGSYGGYLASTMTSTTTGYTGTANNFAFLTVEGNTYLYNVTNKAFYTCESAQKYKEVASPAGSVITFAETDQEGCFSIMFGSNYLNMSANGYDYALVINSWGGSAGYWDEGNRLTITAVDDFDATEALAAIDAYLHPAASYKVVVVDSETETEYTVAEGIAAGIGDVIDAMPDNLKLDYCNYTVAEPLTIAEGSDNTLFVEADYEGLPFETGKWYYMTVRSAYAVAGDGTITCQSSMPDASNDAAAWSFSGNPYAGIAVTNRSTGDGYTIGYDAVVVAKPGADLYMKAGDTRWMISQNSTGFVLRIPENPSIYLHNRNPKLSTCSVSEWSYVHDDAGSTIALIEMPEPIDPAVYTVPVDATVDMTTGTFTEFNAANTLAKHWVSNESPKVDFVCNGGNNMVGGTTVFNEHDAGNSLGIFKGQTYQISVENGYVIAGYTITGVNMDDATSTITAGSDSHEFTTEESTFEKTLDEYAYSTSFNVSGTGFLKLNEFTVHLMKPGSTEPVVETFTKGYFNVFNYATDKVLGVDDYNMNTVSIPTEYTAKWTSIVDNEDGTFKISLPVKTSSGQHYMHIGSNARWSNGDATKVTFYQVSDPAAETTVATKVESVDLGSTYLIVANYSKDGKDYALTNELYTGSTDNDQRLVSAEVTIADDVITLERNAATLWTAGAVVEPEQKTGLKNADVLFRNVEDGKFLSAGNPQPETQDFALIAEKVAAGVPNQLASYVTSEEGTFYVQLLNESRYAYCGSSGRFSANSAANPLQLFKVDDIYAETFEATKVSEFEATGSAWYLVVGTKSEKTYALTSEMYKEGTSDQRMVGTEVTINENAISVAASDALLWRFVPSAVEIPTFDAPFFPVVEPEPEPEPTIEGTFRPTTRDAELVAGKEYMIYNAAVASGNTCWGFMHQTDEGLVISGGADPKIFTTDNKNYLFTLADNGDGTYTLKNVGTDAVVGTSYSITKWEESSSIRGGGAALRQDDGTIVPNGDFTGECVFVVTDNNAEDSSKPRWNGQFWTEAGTEVPLLMFGKGHPYAFYVPEEVKVVNNVEVTFYVFDDAEREVATFKAEYPEGTVIENIPDEYKKDFCDYVAAEPLTVSAENNEFFAEVSYNLPFVEGEPYYLQVNGKYVYNDPAKNKNYVAAKTLEEIEAAEDKNMYQWNISGNPYDGYKLFNVGGNKYLALAGDGSTTLSEEAATLGFAVRGDGYTFTCEMGTIEDFYDSFAAIANESQITDALAVITLVQIPENLPQFEKVINLENGVFTKDNGQGSGTLASAWVSNESPVVNFDCLNGNNMIGGRWVFNGNSTDTEHLGLFASTGGINYKVSVEEGYTIKSVTIPGRVLSSATITLTSGSVSQQFTSEGGQAVLSYDEGVSSATFNLKGSAGAFLETAIVVGIEQLPTEDVTFTIYDDEDNHVYTEVVPVLRGSVVSELPDALKRDFTTYTYPDGSLEVTKDGHNVFFATAKFNMPFVADGEAAYNLSVGGVYAYISEEGAVANVSALTDETNHLRKYCWTFYGNPYLGIAVKNVGTEQYLNESDQALEGVWSTSQIAFSEDPVYASLEKNDDGFQLRFGLQNFIALRSGSISIYGYDQASGTEAVRLAVVAAEPDEDINTGIQNINGLNNNDEVYGIDGRRMNQRNILNKGVYVINGKKVLVK